MALDWRVFCKETTTGDLVAGCFGRGVDQTYLNWIISAWGWTLSVALLALLVAMAFGSLMGILRTAPDKRLVFIGTAWTELFRNIPLLVQIFLWYHVLPAIFKPLQAFPSFILVVFALGFFTSARISEQVRAGIQSLPKGQRYAGLAMGLTLPQIVFELHVRQGLPLLAVARVLGLGVEQARELWLQSRAARAAQAPQSESDFALLREHISAALWQTVEATFPHVMADAEDDEDAEPPAPVTPPMLSVRLKALDQIAKLYDLSVEQRAAGFAPLPYATPEEIALSVRERVLEMHRRECGE
jgi:His/Glu/Gln/Arg/opine family amino acid ABC transporter permease subunit